LLADPPSNETIDVFYIKRGMMLAERVACVEERSGAYRVLVGNLRERNTWNA